MNIFAIKRREFLKALSLSVPAALLSTRNLAAAVALDSPDLAQDALRPEYHFLAPHNWMNDPNGPIWWKGNYHLFYQMNPHAAIWGDMHWGHAISKDMIHWRHLPIALAPTPGGSDSEGCFSGSAVVRDGVPTFVYTGVQNSSPELATIRDGSNKLRETQMVATAEDDQLLHWKKLETPVIASPPKGMEVTGFRDPCPWQEADGWYLAVGSGERGKGGCVLLYRSQDLRQWEYLHPLVQGLPAGLSGANPVDSGDMWECPDFFPLGKQHCLLYSTEGKVIWTAGSYDREKHIYTPKRQGVLDHGAFYAPKSFLAPDGRRILWGWIQETRPQAEFAAAGWSGAMSLPRVLSVGQQGQLEFTPAVEVERLRGVVELAAITPSAPFRRKLTDLRQELRVSMGLNPASYTVRLLVNSTVAWELSVDVPGNAVHCGQTSFPLPSLPWPRPTLRLFLDGSVVECMVGGREAVTSRVYSLKPGETELEVSMTGQGETKLGLWPLSAISSDRLTA